VCPVTTVTVLAPAKVNLQLAVDPVRPDGYHDVVTVYQAVSLFDEVTVALPRALGNRSITASPIGHELTGSC
jgi:4-diphosphocytidyl-2-C-methyl-D-erythritol kinase